MTESNPARYGTTLASRLEWLRHEWRKSYAGMDTHVGISAGSFNRYINDDRQPTAPVLQKLCSMGVSAEWLLNGQGKPFATPEPSEGVRRIEYSLEQVIAAVQSLGQATAALAPMLSAPDRERLLRELAGLASGLNIDPLS